jgi:hypothetical protein
VRSSFLISNWIGLTVLLAATSCARSDGPIAQHAEGSSPSSPAPASSAAAVAPGAKKIGALSVVEQRVIDKPNGRPTDSAATIDEYVAQWRKLRLRPDAVTPSVSHDAAILAKLGRRVGEDEIVRHLVVNDRGDDYAAIVAAKNDERLVRKGSVSPWETGGSMRHGTAMPVFVGNDLVTVELEKDDKTVVVRREKTIAYRLVLPEKRERFAVDGLVSWNGHWVLEFDDDVVIDGESLKARGGYTEVFDWMLVGGQPLFFFVKDGRVGISHRGEVLPLAYDDVLHGGCCEMSGFNPQQASWGVRFHAKRGVTWLYVEAFVD